MRKFRSVCLIGAGLTACVLSACQKQSAAPAQAEDAAAQIGTVVITEQEVENAIPFLAKEDQKFVKTPIGRQNLVQILTREKLILQDAQANGLDQDPNYQALLAEKRAELDQIYEQFAQRALADFWYEKKSNCT